MSTRCPSGGIENVVAYVRLQCRGICHDLYISVRHQHVDDMSIEKEDKRLKDSIPGHYNLKG